MRLLIVDALIHDGIHPQFSGSVLLENGTIREVLSDAAPQIEADEIYQAQGRHLLPGLIDIHLHGGCGFDFLKRPARQSQRSASVCLRKG